MDFFLPLIGALLLVFHVHSVDSEVSGIQRWNIKQNEDFIFFTVPENKKNADFFSLYMRP